MPVVLAVFLPSWVEGPSWQWLSAVVLVLYRIGSITRLKEVSTGVVELLFGALMLLSVGEESPAVLVLLTIPSVRITLALTPRFRGQARILLGLSLGLAPWFLHSSRNLDGVGAVFLYTLCLVGYLVGIELFENLERANSRRFELLKTALYRDPVATYDRFLAVQQRYESMKSAFGINSGFIAEVVVDHAEVLRIDFAQRRYPRSLARGLKNAYQRIFSSGQKTSRDQVTTFLDSPYVIALDSLPNDDAGGRTDPSDFVANPFSAFTRYYFPEATSYVLIRVPGTPTTNEFVMGFLSSQGYFVGEWPLATEFAASRRSLVEAFEQCDSVTEFLADVTNIAADLDHFTPSAICQSLVEFGVSQLGATTGLVVLDLTNGARGAGAPTFRSQAAWGLEARDLATPERGFSSSDEPSELAEMIKDLEIPASVFAGLPGYQQGHQIRLVGRSLEAAGRAIESLDARYTGYRRAFSGVRSSLLFPIVTRQRLLGYLILNFLDREHRRRRFAQSGLEKQLLSLCSQIVGQAIESSALLERERQ